MTNEEMREHAILAAAQATDAAAELLRFVREGTHHHGPFGDAEPVEKLLEAVKLAIDIEDGGEISEDRGQIYSAVLKHIEGWAG